MTTTYTEDEFQTALRAATAQAVREAVSALQTEVEALKAAQADSEIEAQVQAAKDEAATAIADMQAKLDEAEVRASAATQKLTDTEAYLTAEADERDRLEQAESRREERKAAVAEFNFTDEHIEASLDHWTELNDEVFAVLCDGWRQVAASVATAPPVAPAAKASALSTTRTTASTTADPAADLRAMAKLSRTTDLGSF